MSLTWWLTWDSPISILALLPSSQGGEMRTSSLLRELGAPLKRSSKFLHPLASRNVFEALQPALSGTNEHTLDGEVGFHCSIVRISQVRSSPQSPARLLNSVVSRLRPPKIPSPSVTVGALSRLDCRHKSRLCSIHCRINDALLAAPPLSMLRSHSERNR